MFKKSLLDRNEIPRPSFAFTVTPDQPGKGLIWRRASPIANALVSVILAMAAPGMTKAAAEVGVKAASIASVTDGPDARTDSQSAAGSISGRVVDPSGAVIPGATLMLLSEDTGEAQTTVSSDDGTFRFLVKTDGLYMLTTAREGFRSNEVTGLNLAIGQDNQLDITMEARLTYTLVSWCGLRPRSPLRKLCSASDRIVVARPTRSVNITSYEATHLTRTSLIVSSTLKGESNERLVNVYHFVKGDPEQGHFPRGEHLLFFLKHRVTSEDPQSAGGYELAEYSRIVRKLPSSELDVYVQRIIELTSLSREEERNPEAMVEWLVRCVEDPATRWEGAFDLAASAKSFRASLTQNDSDEGSVDEINQSSEAPGSGNNVELAALLTQDQKERLLKVLLSADEVTEGERDLIELLKDFNDPRLLSFLVSQLRKTEDNPPAATPSAMYLHESPRSGLTHGETSNYLVRVVAELLNNKSITAHAESYRAAYDDEEDEEDTNEDHDTARTQSGRARKLSTQMRLFLQQIELVMKGWNSSAGKK